MSRADFMGRTADSVYNRAGRATPYIDIKYHRWLADFRRVSAGFALVAKARRMGAPGVAQFAHYAARGRAIRPAGGKMAVYANGPFAEVDRLPSADLLAICESMPMRRMPYPYCSGAKTTSRRKGR